MTSYGALTFGAVPADLRGNPDRDGATIRSVVEQGIRAEKLGLDGFGVGEHHRADIPVSAPDVLLTAIAAQTEKIILGSAVTVLSSDDPVRVYQRFATLDAVSAGRAQPILGRGSFTESFPLFGFNLKDYDQLFEERAELFARLRHEGAVTWRGSTRSNLENQHVHPKTGGKAGLVTWVGVGGNPNSVLRAAQYGYHLMLAGLGQTEQRLRQYLNLFDQALESHSQQRMMRGLSVVGYVAATDEQAREEAWPTYNYRFNEIGKERGWGPIDRARFNREIDHGLLMVGSPDTVGKRLGHLAKNLNLDRLDFNYDDLTGTLEQKRSVLEHLGKEALPVARRIQE